MFIKNYKNRQFEIERRYRVICYNLFCNSNSPTFLFRYSAICTLSLHGYTVHQYDQSFYCPTNALNYINRMVIKNTLKIQKLLRHVSVHAGTIIREPKSVPS
jgi:hypothetical protein